jgi:hypothetical protein
MPYICTSTGCKTQPSFGYTRLRPLRCKTHILPQMVNVVSKHCKHSGCTRFPSLGLIWGKATHCSLHASLGMENVISRRCAYGSCNTIASMGLAWDKATHCSLHAPIGMEHVFRGRRAYKNASLGDIQKRPTHSAGHVTKVGLSNKNKRARASEPCEVTPPKGYEDIADSLPYIPWL